MKLLLNFNGKPSEKPFKHSLLVSFPSLNHGISFLGKGYKTVESWTEAVRRQLLAMGISDFQYTYPPKKDPDAPLQINFLFENELNKLQFLGIVFGDRKGLFTRTISSQEKPRSDVRLKNIESFLNANDISHQIMIIDDLSFTIVTYCAFDDLAIATHFANDFFDRGIENIASPHTARLLTKS